MQSIDVFRLFAAAGASVGDRGCGGDPAAFMSCIAMQIYSLIA